MNSALALDPIIGGGFSNAILSAWQVNEDAVGFAPFGLIGSQLPLYTGPAKVPAGSRISGIRFTGPLDLSNGNIVIEKSLFQPTSVRRGMPLVTTTDFNTGRTAEGKVVIRDSEFDGSRLSVDLSAMTTAFSGIADLQRNYIHGFGNGIALVATGTQENALIERNYVTRLTELAGNSNVAFAVRDFTDAQRPDRQLIIRGNRFVADTNTSLGALFIQPSSGPIANLTIENNLLEGRGFNLWLENSRFSYRNVNATGNRFISTQWGPTYTNGGEGWSTWQDNTPFTGTVAAATTPVISQPSTPPAVPILPVISLAVNRASVVEDGAANLVYTFTRSGATTSQLTVNYSVSGTATNGTDYNGIATSGNTSTVTFVPGSATATVTVNPTADSSVEPDETVTLRLAAGSGYSIGTNAAISGIIVNDDEPNAISIFDRTGVTVSGQIFNDNQTVELGTAFSSKQAGRITDLKYFRTASDANDTDVRDMRLWRVSDGALLATASVTSTSGQSGWQNVKLNSPVSIVAGQDYVVSYRTNDNYIRTANFFDPAKEDDFDGIDDNAFSDPTGTLNSLQSSVSRSSGVYRYGSQILIPNQTFEGSNYWVDVTFVAATTSQASAPPPPVSTPPTVTPPPVPPLTVTPPTATLPTITLAGTPGAVQEDGSSNLVYTFTRTGSISSPLSINYNVGGSATNGTDYTGINSGGDTKSISFAAGAASTSVTINPTADSSVEPNETVTLTVLQGNGYSIGNLASATGTITNDDVTLTGAGVTPAFGWLANDSTVGLAPFGINGEDLPVYTGPYKVPAGSYISGVRFTRNVDLSAGDITIEKSMFQPVEASRGAPIVTTTDFSQSSLPSPPGKVIIRDSEFDGTLLSDETAAWATGFWGIADMQRNYIHHFGGGIALYNTGTQLDSLIEGNYITDMLGWGDPATTGNHSDTFTIRDFTDAARPDRQAIVRNNNFDNESPNVTGSFFIQANSRIDNVLIEGNLLTGGGFNLALEQNRGGYSNIKAIDNRFTPTGYGPVYTTGGEGWAAWQSNFIYNPGAANAAGTTVFQ